ncbi:MAG: CoA transferase [Gammaproteobacteria bacterium]|nr:CoA transferase [Gammaproteobacteria bacterium]
MNVSLEALVESIADGASVAIAPDYSGCAMAAVRALIRKRVKDLHLVTVPQAGFQADMLIGAGCVASVETAGVTLGEHGTAPRFSEAVRSGAIEIRDATCPAIHAALQASE